MFLFEGNTICGATSMRVYWFYRRQKGSKAANTTSMPIRISVRNQMSDWLDFYSCLNIKLYSYCASKARTRQHKALLARFFLSRVCFHTVVVSGTKFTLCWMKSGYLKLYLAQALSWCSEALGLFQFCPFHLLHDILQHEKSNGHHPDNMQPYARSSS